MSAKRPTTVPPDAAQQLACSWMAKSSPENLERFMCLSDDVIANGDDTTLAEAISIVRGSSGPNESRTMEALFSSTAAMAFRPKGNTVVSMHLFAIAVALAPGARPPGDAIKASLERSRMFTGARIRIANGWCSPKDIAALKPVAARSVLLDIAAGRAPAATLLRDAPPAGDFAVLLAVEMTTVDEATPLCVLMDHGANMQDAYEEWRDALVKDVRGIEDALCPCMPSALAAEIDINEFEAMPADSVADLDADDDGMEIPGSRPMAPANDQAKPRYLH